MQRRMYTLAGIMLLVIGLIGCGASSPPPQTALKIMTMDFKYDQTKWVVPKNASISIQLENKGTVEHEWVVLKKGQQISLPFSDDDEDKIFWEIEAEPNEAKTETFTSPAEPGMYEIVCGIPAHIEQGMKASLEVK